MLHYVDAQRELDSQISRLERDLVEFKRRRNQLSPISQLPPEITEKIFLFSLEDLSRDANWGKVPVYMRIAQVSRAWRAIALGCPGLWTSMRIRPRTDPRLLEFQMKNAKSKPLSIQYLDYAEYPLDNVMDMCKIIVASIRRLKVIDVQARGATLDTLLLPAQQSLDQAEELEEVLIRDLSPHGIWHGRPPSPLLDLFVGGTPKLRTIRLYDVPLRWDSSTLISPCLTELSLQYSPWYSSFVITRGAALQLFSALRHMPQLNALTLGFPITPWQVTDIQDPAWTTGLASVVLPNLKSFVLHTQDSTPLTTVMSVIVLPKDIELVELKSFHIPTPPLGVDISQTMATIQNSFHQLPSPDSLSIATFEQESQSIILSTFGSAAVSPAESNVVSSRAARPKVSVEFLPDGDPYSGPHSFPVCDSQSSLLFEWWLKDLRALSVEHNPPSQFWDVVSELPFLTELTYRPTSELRARSLFQVLSGQYRSSATSEWELPFRPLKTLVIDLKYVTSSSSPVSTTGMAIRALRRRQEEDSSARGVEEGLGIRLNVLKFVNCEAALDPEVETKLRSVATNVVWRLRKRLKTSKQLPI
ncbi:hypothetical protein NMY22_g6919 [Coprinellus aureogranulatus]|nr:hypothetical protein NMY22_g6919 [Coprinellus aureogranulatus]